MLQRFAIGFRMDTIPLALVRHGCGFAEPKELDICEVGMQFTRCGTMRSGADVLSGILNCVCPECGGRMGERGREFRCRGECHQDWRQAWEQAAAILVPRSKRRIRRG